MRIIDGRTIEVECNSCACVFTTTRGEDGEPDEILCSECREALNELRQALMVDMDQARQAIEECERENERTWWEGFLSFPFKALPAPNRTLEALNWADEQMREMKARREHEDLMDAADQAAYYSPKWEENQ